MSCRQPPPLTLEQLSAVLDGQAEPAIDEHLAVCPECAMRLEEARQFDRHLASRLYRWDCPSPQALADYHLGRLEVEAATSVTRHAEHCPSCAAELNDLRAFLAAGEVRAPAPAARLPEGSFAARLGGLVAQLIPRQSALALRGETQGPVTAAVGDILLVLEAQPAQAGLATLIGQLAAPEQDQWTGALVQLWRNGVLGQTTVLDDAGGFRLDSLEPGAVDLKFTPAAGEPVLWPDFAVEP
ncbi:MAG: hypothetical protein IT318_08045 [Anaerolineales bacterium]|nr:hypothetical protein [Anaerolineales bacterium]